MVFPERFSNLPEYAFPRLRGLLDAHAPGGEIIHMTIGEPKHAFPDWVGDIVAQNVAGFAKYPLNDGTPALRTAISNWVQRRFGISVDPETQLMALNGTREGLFNACIALCPESTVSNEQSLVLIPNPFYQVYAAAALATNAQPIFVAANAENGFLPDYASLDPQVLANVEIAYLCSPSNPQGAVASREYLTNLIALAEKYDFKIFSDECYSEIYRDEPPLSALQVAKEVGADPERVLIFHSLSKRSNLPGLRSGFVAGGPDCIARIKHLRAFAGAPLPSPLQHVAEKVWSDEAHVVESRKQYVDKYQVADTIFASVSDYTAPIAGFFLWMPVENGEAAALKLWRETGVRVLPGAYLGREVDGKNPGENYIRVAMVAPIKEMQRGLIRLRDCLYH
ncbi:MAG: aminotransferase class I/II-fold pyridoxal phosphate-dependent enzyme [Paracoccaceae bacterium]